jgi:energy-coupling factor transporter ATP-binding protein EcfA2
MPSINRIRIINFSYNHDSRHIVDETFNFHGGENALLNLSNGGGKSVLVQLFLQVIVPMAKIQGRNIASFFRKKSQPTYIMIEWKLDGGGGYLLTGIGMTSAEAVEGEGTKPRVRYFNFTSKYSAANPWDIMNIPVATRHGGVLEIKPFREARKLLAEQERKNPYLLGYFPEDDRNGYARRLAEFGISQDEWRNVITRINDSENGLEDLFQKYRSSSQLLDDWIIKTVEKVMFKGRSQAGHLEEMLQGLVQEVIENERFIIEKQLFSGFLDRLQNLLGKLETLIKNLEEQKGLGAKLAALHHFFNFSMKSQIITFFRDLLQLGFAYELAVN